MTDRLKIMFLVFCTVTLAYKTAFALQLKVSEKQLIDQSEYIVAGQVVAESSYWNPEMMLIYTDYTVEISEAVKNNPGTRVIIVRIIGGKIEDIQLAVTDQPRLKVGEDVLMHLRKGDQGKMRVLSGFQGKSTTMHGVIQKTGESIRSYSERVAKMTKK